MKTISAAFVRAKREFGPALKDKTNPAFRSKYADLGACIDAVEDALLAQGIAAYQETFEDATGVTVETVFLHESGESLRCGKLHVPAAKQDPQGYGSALTYARRYSLMAACGIAAEDDDGNAASKQKPKTPPSPPPRVEPPPPPMSDAKPTSGAGEGLDPDRKAELEEMALYFIECHREGNDLPAINGCAEVTDADEKVYLWKLMATESKLRATIKANSKTKEAPTQ